MRAIYAEANMSTGTTAIQGWFSSTQQRTNICRSRWQASGSLMTSFSNTNALVVASLGTKGFNALPTTINYAFTAAKKLRKITNDINATNCTSVVSAFSQCAALEEVRIRNLKVSISFSDSPLLSKQSLLYMIENSASGASFTITLHPDKYEECQMDTEIQDALAVARENGINITLGR